MGYRRDKPAARRWRRWLERYGAELAELPLPPLLSSSEAIWLHFIEHGAHPGDATGFDAGRLAPEQAAALGAFFRRQAEDGEYVGCMLRLAGLERD